MMRNRHARGFFRKSRSFVLASVAGCACSISLASIFEDATNNETTVDGGLSRGVAFGDADGDGDPDLLVANTINYPEFLYRNDGTRFVQIMETEPSLAGGFSEGVSWVDFDNDGDLDIFVARTRGTDDLYRNDGDWQFSRATPQVVAQDARSSSMACWADIDLDGWLDLFVVRREGQDDSLYRNIGGRDFHPITALPARRGGDGRACAFGDVDGDGDADLYVGNFIDETTEPEQAHQNYLFINQGELVFSEITSGDAVESRALTYGASFADVDNDDDPDLFVANIGRGDTNMLYLNDGRGNFVATPSAISEDVGAPSKGHAWGDFDLDGDLDLAIANGTEGSDRIANQLFRNEGHAHFEAVTSGPFVSDRGVSAGLAWADIDADGDLDLYVANWGNSDEDNALYINNIRGNWLILSLAGNPSNRMALGAKVTVISSSSSQTRWLYPQTGYASQNEPIVHFGLADAITAELIEVVWPSGHKTELHDVSANRLLVISESESN